MVKRVFSREELYKLVWEAPLVRAAEQLGMSDVWLAKVCRRNQIPIPKRGFWNLPASDRPPNRPPLLPVENPRPIVVNTSPAPNDGGDAPALQVGAAATSEVRRHPLVSLSEVVLRGRDYYGMWRDRSRDPPCLWVHVTKESLSRALAYLDRLFDLMESRGHRVLIRGGGPFASVIEVLDEKFPFKLEERYRDLPPDRVWRHPGDGHLVRHEGTGRLQFFVYDLHHEGVKRSWTDAPGRPIEDGVGAVACSLETVAERRRMRRIESARERAEWQEQYRRKARREAILAARESLLLNHAKRWSLVERLSAYVAAVEKTALPAVALAVRQDLESWVAWAKQHIETIDPIRALLDELPRAITDKIDE